MTRYLHNKNNIFTNMHIILSPAKTMAGTSKIKAPAGTTPRFNQEAIEIALHMAQYPAEELGRMLKLSPKLMMESYHRFQNFHSAEEEPLQALLAYTGVVFKNINPKDFTEADRLSEDEYADFTARLAPYGISQSEFLRQAIRRATIRPVIHVSAVNDELLSAVGKLAAEYGRIGGNLNQIARYLNEYGAPYNALSGEVRAAIADLAALKYEVLQKVGDAVGNTQAYQL